MKAVAKLVLAAAFMPFLSACGPADELPAASTIPEIPAVASVTPEQALNQYADELVANNTPDFSGHEPALMTSSQPLAYVFTFKTIGSKYATKMNISDNDQAGYEGNLKITNRWQTVYCTEELKQIMRSHGVFSAGAHIVGSRGQKYSIAICTV